MVWALTGECQRHLSRQFENRQVKKEYEALVTGILPGNEGVIEMKQRLDVDNRPLQIADEVHGKLSVTRWKVLDVMSGNISRVRLYPETGRTHQLRLHMASLQVPILGDRLYGRPDFQRLALHACSLEFRDPLSGHTVIFSSDVPF